jgi:hypothetical protein
MVLGGGLPRDQAFDDVSVRRITTCTPASLKKITFLLLLPGKISAMQVLILNSHIVDL